MYHGYSYRIVRKNKRELIEYVAKLSASTYVLDVGESAILAKCIE